MTNSVKKFLPVLRTPHCSTHGHLKYSIYPICPTTNLQAVRNYTLNLISTRTDNFIWNHDPFNLTYQSSPVSAGKLSGEMDIGEDSTVCADEWVVVGALWDMSRRFQDVAIR